jgi:hypothetical protein
MGADDGSPEGGVPFGITPPGGGPHGAVPFGRTPPGGGPDGWVLFGITPPGGGPHGAVLSGMNPPGGGPDGNVPESVRFPATTLLLKNFTWPSPVAAAVVITSSSTQKTAITRPIRLFCFMSGSSIRIHAMEAYILDKALPLEIL